MMMMMMMIKVSNIDISFLFQNVWVLIVMIIQSLVTSTEHSTAVAVQYESTGRLVKSD